MTTARHYRCFVAPTVWGDGPKRVQDPEAHHLISVLRVTKGDHLTLFDGAGREADVRITGVARDSVRVEIDSQRVVGRPSLRLTLVPALLRPQKMDLVMEKATELGATHIHPVTCEHCVVQMTPAQADKRVLRWTRIIKESARQCGNAWPPEVRAPVSLCDWLAEEANAGHLLVASLGSDARPLCDALTERRGGNNAIDVALIVGPEGDFTPDETRIAREAGAVPVSLGAQTLRAETASIAGLAMLVYELGLRSGI